MQLYVGKYQLGTKFLSVISEAVLKGEINIAKAWKNLGPWDPLYAGDCYIGWRYIRVLLYTHLIIILEYEWKTGYVQAQIDDKVSKWALDESSGAWQKYTIDKSQESKKNFPYYHGKKTDLMTKGRRLFGEYYTLRFSFNDESSQCLPSPTNPSLHLQV